MIRRRCRCLGAALPPLPMVAVPLLTQPRLFIQGTTTGPTQVDKDGMRRYLASHREEMEERHRRKMEAIDAYYTSCNPDAPLPLHENSFTPGVYGMRRRIHSPTKTEPEIDVRDLRAALDEGNNAMRK